METMTVRPLLLRPEVAAEALGISRARLYELFASGHIETVKIGKSRRVPLAELEAYVERLRQQAASATAAPGGQR